MNVRIPDVDYQGVLIHDKRLGTTVEHLMIKGQGRTLCGAGARFKRRRKFLWIGAVGCYACRCGYSASAKTVADW